MNLLDDIRNFVVMTFLFGDPVPLQDDASLMDGGIIDSTGILELVTFMEATYHVTIENEEMMPENLDSVSRLARFLAKKLDSAAAVAQTPTQGGTQAS
jgi:acyl carrier protein